ncbi:MAG: hypothetical protein WCP98_13695 [Actinomycetes bacterium]
MSVQGLREAQRSRGDGGEPAARSRALLSLKEVRASGLPAFFFDHGEHLLYMDGELFDLRDGDAAWQAGSRPLPLPRQILESGVGLELGWRHAADCRCRYCRKRAPLVAAQAAVA